MNRRLELVRHTFSKKEIRGSLKAWLLNCFGPTCSVLAKSHIQEVAEEEGLLKIKIRNIPSYLYYPKNFSLQPLYQTLAEQLYAWQWHYYQVPQTTVDKKDIVLDCGCAEGSFAFIAQQQAAHVYAIEPLPEYVKVLKKTFASSNNVSIIETALGSKQEDAYIKSAGIASSITFTPTNTKVTIDTIDNICHRYAIKPTYLKADLEGYEMFMLAGAKEVIRKYKPKIAITTYHKEHHAREIKELLKNLVPSYQIKVKGLEERKGAPVMLHAWMA